MSSTSAVALAADEVAPTTPRPVGERERIAALDVLRGFALLGILAMNIRSFSGPFSTYINPFALYAYSGASRVAYWATTLLFDTKMLSIFSMLFGAGAIIYGAKEAAGDVSHAKVWHRRNFWLLVIGMIHGYLIWEGDILVVYSLCALTVLWWTRKLPAWALVVLAAVMLSVGGLLTLGHETGFNSLSPDEQAEERSSWQPTADQLLDEVDVYRDGYLGILAHRAPGVLFLQTIYFLLFFLWRAGGMMVLGQALMKLGVLSGERSGRFYVALALLGYAIGLPLVWVGLQQLDAKEYAVPQRFTLDLFNYFGSIAVALGHVGLLLWLLRQWPTVSLFGRLASVGRMALTNYLMQSVICTTLFYGYGFNLFARLDYAQQLIVVAAVWALQLLFSPWWLERFYFGPAEWLWRWLTYGTRPPMRRTGVR